MATEKSNPALTPTPGRIRAIEPRDDAAMASVIRTVMTEFGATGAGFSINDPEVDFLSRAYAAPRSAFFVIELGGDVVGGAGIAPLAGGDADTCELRKMYFLPTARGRGLGSALLTHCLQAARSAGFTRCYLETLTRMTEAARLYERHGFERVERPLGATGHFTCDRWYQRTL
jgi:putative acetyltransferase